MTLNTSNPDAASSCRRSSACASTPIFSRHPTQRYTFIHATESDNPRPAGANNTSRTSFLPFDFFILPPSLHPSLTKKPNQPTPSSITTSPHLHPPRRKPFAKTLHTTTSSAARHPGLGPRLWLPYPSPCVAVRIRPPFVAVHAPPLGAAAVCTPQQSLLPTPMMKPPRRRTAPPQKRLPQQIRLDTPPHSPSPSGPSPSSLGCRPGHPYPHPHLHASAGEWPGGRGKRRRRLVLGAGGGGCRGDEGVQRLAGLGRGVEDGGEGPAEGVEGLEARGRGGALGR